MKQNFKNYLKLGILLFGIFSMSVSCQKDNFETNSIDTQAKTKSGYSIRTVDMNTIKQNKAANDALATFKEKKSYTNLSGDLNKIVAYESLNVLVEDSEAIYMEKEDGTYHSYTFKAVDMDDVDQKKNLVLSYKDDGTYRVVLINYYLTPEDLEAYLTTGALDLDSKMQFQIVDESTYIMDVYSKTVSPSDSGGGPDCWVPDITPGSMCTEGVHS